MDTFERRVDELEEQLREGSPWGQREVARVNKDLDELKVAHEELKKTLLSPDTIAELVNKALQKAKARGWTNRERWMGVVLLAIAVGTLIINLINLKQGHPK